MERKQLRKAMSPAGWITLIYSLLMMLCVTVTMLVEALIYMIISLGSGCMDNMTSAVYAASNSAWGYLVAVAVGIIILLAWKKPRYWKEEIWAKGKPMDPGAFVGILCIFLAMQVFYQIYFIVLELLLNVMDLSILEGLESMNIAGSDSLSMFLYACILAPVSEELLFRGLVQRTLMPFGRKLAILGSAFLFGLMHGNVMQIPFAFLSGLVLGYVASEYSIAWAMLLHMINNLVLGDMLSRLTSGMGDTGAGLVMWLILILAAIGAIITLIRKRHQVRAWMRLNTIRHGFVGCFFGSAGVVTFTIVMVLSTIVTTVMMITPI